MYVLSKDLICSNNYADMDATDKKKKLQMLNKSETLYGLIKMLCQNENSTSNTWILELLYQNLLIMISFSPTYRVQNKFVANKSMFQDFG